MDKNLPLPKKRLVDYRVRVSARARNVRLQISSQYGLVVVAPRYFDLARIPALIEQKRKWIESHLRRFAEMPGGRETRPALILPDVIDLPALGEAWQVRYNPMNTAVVGIVSEAPGELIVYGAVHHQPACREVLINWLRRRTREELCAWLSTLAAEYGFTFRESVVRGQKTRWGSCSAKGTISLSYKLLFLERDWVRCVLLHELCHTVIMNHSEDFRSLLNRLEPKSRQIDREMREAARRVPVWVEKG
ncbi:MAG: M48 family metallopeptidase [Syntrophobacterales bacterium]|nr:M48 family metallopeptidase [Syntrophobacterales bacterium]